MPGEEGYPTYLGNRLGHFYERAGRAVALGGPEREGSVTMITAVSPPGGDLSEPVTQAALRVVGGLWALDSRLAHQRQFPAVDWPTSWSLYTRELVEWFAREGGADWDELRTGSLALLAREADLREIAGLLGADSLQDADRLVLAVGALTREHLLGQSAYEPHDASSSLAKTGALARLLRELLAEAGAALAAGAAAAEAVVRAAASAALARSSVLVMGGWCGRSRPERRRHVGAAKIRARRRRRKVKARGGGGVPARTALLEPHPAPPLASQPEHHAAR
jgi:V/A-type H+-transporting ATPase subunit A